MYARFTFRAVVGLPITITDAHIVACAFPVPITGVCAFSLRSKRESEDSKDDEDGVDHRKVSLLFTKETALAGLDQEKAETVNRFSALEVRCRFLYLEKTASQRERNARKMWTKCIAACLNHLNCFVFIIRSTWKLHIDLPLF